MSQYKHIDNFMLSTIGHENIVSLLNALVMSDGRLNIAQSLLNSLSDFTKPFDAKRVNIIKFEGNTPSVNITGENNEALGLRVDDNTTISFTHCY